MGNEDRDDYYPDKEYVSEDGDVWTPRQLAHRVRSGGGSVERTEDGFIVDGVLYEPADELRLVSENDRIETLNNQWETHTNDKNKSLFDSAVTLEDVEWCFSHCGEKGTKLACRLLAGFADEDPDYVTEYREDVTDALTKWWKRGKIDSVKPYGALIYIAHIAPEDPDYILANLELLHNIDESTNSPFLRNKLDQIFRALPSQSDEITETEALIETVVNQTEDAGNQERVFHVLRKPRYVSDETPEVVATVESITRVSSVSMDADRHRYAICTPDQKLISGHQIRDIIERDTTQTDVSTWIDNVQTGTPTEQHLALLALESVSEEELDEVANRVAVISNQIDEPGFTLSTLDILNRVAEYDPATLEAVVPQLASTLSAAHSEEVRRTTIEVLNSVITEVPLAGVGVELPPALHSCLQDDIEKQQVYSILVRIGKEDAEEVVPVARQILQDIDVDDPQLAAAAFGGFAHLIPKMPDVTRDVVETAVRLCEQSDSDYVRANATGALSDAAGTDVDLVAENIARVLDSIEDIEQENTEVQNNVALLLFYVTEEQPEMVEDWTDLVMTLAGADEPRVRYHAVGSLGHLKCQDALALLSEIRDNDESENVQEMAEWAIHRIKSQG